MNVGSHLGLMGWFVTKSKGGPPLAVFFLALMSFLFFGCVQGPGIIDAGNQVQLRSMQTRVFNTSKKKFVMRGVLATLQDLNFVIDKVDADLGTVSGTKLYEEKASFLTPVDNRVREDLDHKTIRITITIQPKSEEQMRVRASLQYKLRSVKDPKPYQQFFSALSKSLFLSEQLDEPTAG